MSPAELPRTVKIKTLVIAVSLFAVLAAVWALSMEIDSPDLGEAILQKAGAAAGIQLKASRFKWSLTRGLVAEDVDARSSFPGGRFTVHIDQIVFEHELLPLLAGKVVIRRLIMTRPRTQILRARNSPGTESAESVRNDSAFQASTPAAASSSFDLRLQVLEFDVEDGALMTSGFQSGRSGVSLDGLDLAFRDLQFYPGAITPVHGLVSHAEIEARTIDVDSIQLRDVGGRVVFNRGRVAVSDLDYSTANGTFRARLEVDFNQIPFGYEISLESNSYNIEPYVGSRDDNDVSAGSLLFEAKGYGSDLNNASGQGVLHLRGGVLPSSPIVAEAEENLGRGGLTGSSYEPVEIRFGVKDGRLTVQPFELRTESSTLAIDGSARFDAALSLNITVDVVDGIAPFYLRVTGTVDDPVVEIVTSNQ